MIQSKLPHVGTTIFTVMSRLAAEYQAINLSQGFPDFDIDRVLLDKVQECNDKPLHQYAPMAGIPALRLKIQNLYEDMYGTAYDPDTEILVTSGASEAIFSSIAALVRAGDEVIIFEPAYDLYQPVVELLGGKCVPVRMTAPAFTVDWERVENAITPKTRLIIINNPNNPSSKVWPEEDMLKLEDIVCRNNIWVIADEVYGWLMLNGQVFYSVSQYPQLKARSIIAASFGKLLHCTGWKIGYCLAPVQLMEEIKKVHQFNVFTVNHALQYAIADYLEDRSILEKLPPFFQAKYERLAGGLQAAGFRVLPADGTYFLLADYSSISELGDVDFTELMVKKYGVAAIPVSAFYHDHYDARMVRFCFAKKEETLDAAIELLKTIALP